IRLEVFRKQQLTLALRNSIGQVVFKASKAAGSGRFYTIPTQGFSKGMYSVTVSVGNKTQTERVLIQ
ncbi:MAG: T9SS type A sorting domain-containing protein, partial [Segetibacter sp.]|nr:T9SS type A sorting domain-containing protein [Segetibacter sp.]